MIICPCRKKQNDINVPKYVISNYLSFLVSSQLEMLATLDRHLLPLSTAWALHSQYNFFSRLCLFPEHDLCLTSITTLFAVVTSLSCKDTYIMLAIPAHTPTLSIQWGFPSLVLGHLKLLMPFTGLAKCLPLLGYVHLRNRVTNVEGTK